jgi:hypothetical protein
MRSTSRKGAAIGSSGLHSSANRKKVCVDARVRPRQFVEPVQCDLPCPVQLRKIFRLNRRANQRYDFARLTRQEGRLAIVTNVRWDAVDTDVPLTNGTEVDGEVVWF